MNATLFDDALKAGLVDQAGVVWDSDTRAKGAMRAALAYSNYRPVLRRFSTGNLFSPCSAGDATITVIGGVWRVGDSVRLFDANVETRTVSAVAIVEETTEPIPAMTLTLSVVTTSAHPAGTLVQRLPTSGQSVAGLNVLAQQDTYALPLDWLRPDQASLDLAVGATADVRHEMSFYDASYGIAGALSGVGYGSASNFVGGYLGGGTWFPMAGGNALAPGAGLSQTLYRFLRSEPPMLVITPTPTEAAVLDFYYYGAHTIASIPGGDMEPVLCYALYAVLMAMASRMGGEVDYATGSAEKVYPSKSAEQLRENAASLLAQWERRMVRVPIAVSG